MIKINTLLAAYNFGKKFSKTSFGRTFFLRYKDIKSELSPETWSLYQNAMRTCSFQHYFCFGLAYKKIEAACSEDYKESFAELENCSEVHSLIEEGDKIGRDLENYLIQMFAKLPLRDASVPYHSLDLYRDWMKIFYQLHSTKLFSYLHQHKANIENKQENVQKFIETKEITPFSKHNREIIRKLAINETDKDSMYSFEFFESIRNLVLQVIFETHFNLNFHLNRNEIVHYREKVRNKFRVFSTKVFGTGVFRYQGNFILLLENNELQDIGLIKRKVGRNMDLGKKSVLTIEGLLYPKNDYNLFVPDLPN
ncbi:hypothetical protein [Metabacillus sp. cB07]|uniref:hypothetical protein n=1 Tax=Metabacillus sp. cB07 TaxID=2806989 RepID=UPI0019396322|nr:hypothetical protein [Metabacillus sp. cB07]